MSNEIPASDHGSVFVVSKGTTVSSRYCAEEAQQDNYMLLPSLEGSCSGTAVLIMGLGPVLEN